MPYKRGYDGAVYSRPKRRHTTYSPPKATQFGGSYKRRGQYFRKSSYGAIMRTKSTSGATQKAQIAGLSKRVNALAQVQARRTQTYLAAISKDQYLNDNDANLLGNTDVYSAIPLINFTNSNPTGTKWEPIFGTDDTTQKPNFLLKKIALKWQIICDNDAKAVDGTLVIMAPKTKEVSNDFAANGLVDKIDYYQGEGTPNRMAGHTMINLKRWRVFYMKRFTVWGQVQQGSNPVQSVKMVTGSKTLDLGYHLKNSTNDTARQWDDLTFDDLPYYMQHLNVFCFNSGDDDNGSSAQLKIQGTVTGATYE